MKTKNILIFLLLFLVNRSYSQCDLISNWDFETMSSCPTTFGQINRATGWFNANSPNNLPHPSTDYVNCGFTGIGLPPGTPPSGTGFIGLNPASHANGFPNGGAEMAGTFVKLCQGNSYDLSFYSVKGGNVQNGTDSLYIMGINTPSFPAAGIDYCPSNMTPLLAIPQTQVYTTNWTQHNFTFTSPANFNAIIIGGVCGSTGTYYIYIDDFRIQTNSPPGGSTISSNSTIPCNGGNATITFNLPTSCYAPYSVTYTVNGNPVTLNNINNGDTALVPVPGPGATTVILTTVMDSNGCISNVNSTLTFTPTGSPANPAWNNPSPICENAGTINLNNLITGTTGGTWSGIGVSGNTFNPTFGNQPITYTVGSPPCQQSQTHTITVEPDVDPNWSIPSSICSSNSNLNLSNLITGTTGGTWSGTGVIGTMFNPSVGTQTITYTVGNSPCQETLSQIITVIPSDTAAFTYPSGSYCLTDPDPSPVNTGTSGGTYSIDNSGVINNSTGVIDITGSGIGSYTVTYITSGSCPDTATFNINIVTSTDATITQAGPFCENDPAVNLVAVDPGGNWTGNGITNATNGTFDPATAGAGNHVITYTISGSCGDVDSITIVVNPSDDASFSYSPTTFCDTDVNPLPTGIVTTGGAFTIDNGGTINGATGEVNLAASGAGSYVITYITNGACPDTNTFSITITTCTVPTAVYTVSDSAICDGDCVTFTDMSTGATAWQWTFTGGNPATANTQGPHTVCFTGPGTYNIELIASNSSGTDTTTSTVEVFANPTIDAGVDVTIDLGQSTTLNATGTNGNYAWTPPTWLSCPTCPTTTATPEETTTYSVTVVDSNGCSVSDNVTVFVDFEYVIWVPNIFSPNGDGSNDIAFVRGVGVETLNFMIYDRWGEKVFETTDLNIGWDGTFRGKKMNNAVFVYYLEATFKNGASTTKKGDITLVR